MVQGSLMTYYLEKMAEGLDLQKELQLLIREYNNHRNSFLFIYASALEKAIPENVISQDDFYTIRDLLVGHRGQKCLDFFIETGGGSGEATEEIVRFLHDNFDHISFVICGEAKSAGTIMVLSGDDILMTETGSLGPIDAQIRVGRSKGSAYDYIEWVREKRHEAEKNGRLNPFDAIMVAQITPDEFVGIHHSLEYAKDLISEWLPKYKFRNWNNTESKGSPVTEEMKRDTANSIADKLTDHSKWRSHGRSIKRGDLEEIVGLKIRHVEQDQTLSDIVYRIHTILRLLFQSTTIYKVYASGDSFIARQATPSGAIRVKQPFPNSEISSSDVASLEVTCPKCNLVHSIYAKFLADKNIDVHFRQKGFKSFPKNSKLRCGCGFDIDLSGIKRDMEIATGKSFQLE